MEESSKNQAQSQVQNQNQDKAQKDKDLITGKDIETGSKLLGFALIFAIVLFLTLNYFNWVSLSLVYPKTFGFLPHRPFVKVQKQIVALPTKTPDKTGLESCSVKKEGNPLVDDVRVIDGDIVGVFRGNIDKVELSQRGKSADVKLISINGRQQHYFSLVDFPGLVYDATNQRNLSLSDLKRGMAVEMSFNCFPKENNLFKITRVAITGRR